jgi:hypothetical protein
MLRAVIGDSSSTHVACRGALSRITSSLVDHAWSSRSLALGADSATSIAISSHHDHLMLSRLPAALAARNIGHLNPVAVFVVLRPPPDTAPQTLPVAFAFRIGPAAL